MASTEDLMAELDRLLDQLRRQLDSARQLARKATGTEDERPANPGHA